MSTATSTTEADWDSMLPSVSEDRLLLLEQSHRVSNELASALAAIHLMRSASGARPRAKLLDLAVQRLEGFAAVTRVLCLGGGMVALDREVERLCVGMASARDGAKRSRISLDLAPITVDAATARRILLVAAELAFNAMRHALDGRDGRLLLTLNRGAEGIALSVIDDGPGLSSSSPSRGTGMGGPIVRELVRRAGGRIDCDTGPDGTTFRVVVPVPPVLIEPEDEVEF